MLPNPFPDPAAGDAELRIRGMAVVFKSDFAFPGGAWAASAPGSNVTR